MMLGSRNNSRSLITVFICTAIAEWFNRVFYFYPFALSTYISIAVIWLGIYYIVRYIKKGDDKIAHKRWLALLLLYSFITIIRGCFTAENYWDWKFLIFQNIPALLVPAAAFLGTDILAIQRLYKFILPAYFIIAFGSLLFISTSQFIYLAAPLYFLILFMPYMTNRKRFMVLVVMGVSILSNPTARSNDIRIILALLLAVSYYMLPKTQSRIFALSLVHKILFFLPVIFISLAIWGNFNVLNMDSYLGELKMKNTEGQQENLTDDTRTFLYKETLATLVNNNTLIFGEGGCGKYDTDFFVDLENDGKRYGCEVGALNIWLFSGIVGLILYGIVFFLASGIAINKSNNRLCKMMGLYLIFRWNYFFIEEFSLFNTNFFFLWLSIGMCLSPTFRRLDDLQIKQRVRGKLSRASLIS